MNLVWNILARMTSSSASSTLVAVNATIFHVVRRVSWALGHVCSARRENTVAVRLPGCAGHWGAHALMARWAPSPAWVHVSIGGPHVCCVSKCFPHVPHPGGRCAAFTPAWGRRPWLLLENTGVSRQDRGRQETVVRWCPGLHHGVPTLML